MTNITVSFTDFTAEFLFVSDEKNVSINDYSLNNFYKVSTFKFCQILEVSNLEKMMQWDKNLRKELYISLYIVY